MPYIPPIRIVATRGYDRRARKLFSAAERAAAELEIALAPDAWPVIPATGGARKARAARGGRGKSGGAPDHLLRRYAQRRSLSARCLRQGRQGGLNGCRET